MHVPGGTDVWTMPVEERRRAAPPCGCRQVCRTRCAAVAGRSVDRLCVERDGPFGSISPQPQRRSTAHRDLERGRCRRYGGETVRNCSLSIRPVACPRSRSGARFRRHYLRRAGGLVRRSTDRNGPRDAQYDVGGRQPRLLHGSRGTAAPGRDQRRASDGGGDACG